MAFTKATQLEEEIIAAIQRVLITEEDGREAKEYFKRITVNDMIVQETTD